MTEVKEQFSLVEKYVQENLKECCQEIVDWRNSTILKNGHVRHASKLLKDVVFEQKLKMVEDMVNKAAIEFCIKNLK